MKVKKESGVFISTGNVLTDILELSKKLSPDGTLDYNLADRVIRMFCGFAGIDTLEQAKDYISKKVQTADIRNRNASGTEMTLEKGDFIKGIGDITYLRNILQNGSVSKEYLGSIAGSDATPLDTDISMIMSSDGTIRDKINSTAARGYGPIWFVLKNDERFITTRTNNKTLDTKKDISKITTNDIEEFYYSKIKEFNMPAKEYSNMSVILKDIFKHAKRDKLILYNVYDDIDMKLNCCKPQTKKKKTERVYLPAEKSKLFKVINEEIKEQTRTNGYAIFLEFKLALRIGELSALKWSDIDYVEKTIHIQRTEALGENRKRVVVEHVKLKSEFGDRYLPLSDYDIQIFELIKKFNEEHKYNSDYIFCNEKGRMTSRQLDNYLRTMCNNANIKEKSMHDIRRTVASEMYKNNVNIEVIRDFLGHSDIQTTFDYIYDCDSEETTKKIIINSLNDNNALDSVLVCTCA